LQDRALVASREQHEAVDPAVDRVIEDVRAHVFPLHGLPT
jgi:hypothetical protein